MKGWVFSFITILGFLFAGNHIEIDLKPENSEFIVIKVNENQIVTTWDNLWVLFNEDSYTSVLGIPGWSGRRVKQFYCWYGQVKDKNLLDKDPDLPDNVKNSALKWIKFSTPIGSLIINERLSGIKFVTTESVATADRLALSTPDEIEFFCKNEGNKFESINLSSEKISIWGWEKENKLWTVEQNLILTAPYGMFIAGNIECKNTIIITCPRVQVGGTSRLKTKNLYANSNLEINDTSTYFLTRGSIEADRFNVENYYSFKNIRNLPPERPMIKINCGYWNVREIYNINLQVEDHLSIENITKNRLYFNARNGASVLGKGTVTLQDVYGNKREVFVDHTTTTPVEH